MVNSYCFNSSLLMFTISRKGDYGLMLVSALAHEQKAGRGFMPLSRLSGNRKMPLKFLSHIASKLAQAGILKSKEGRDGGYGLARSAKKITLIEVLEVLEGPLAPVACCNDKKEKRCCVQETCAVRPVWQDAKNQLLAFLKSRTIADTL